MRTRKDTVCSIKKNETRYGDYKFSTDSSTVPEHITLSPYYLLISWSLFSIISYRA